MAKWLREWIDGRNFICWKYHPGQFFYSENEVHSFGDILMGLKDISEQVNKKWVHDYDIWLGIIMEGDTYLVIDCVLMSGKFMRLSLACEKDDVRWNRGYHYDIEFRREEYGDEEFDVWITSFDIWDIWDVINMFLSKDKLKDITCIEEKHRTRI